MSCSSCGAQLPDRAKFCGECGAPQRSAGELATVPRLPATEPPPAVRWETCTIRYLPRGTPDEGENLRGLRVPEARVIVRIEGPEGVYVAHREKLRYHPISTVRTHNAGAEAKRRLASVLLAQGWEPVPGPANTSFRRPFVLGRVTTF